MFLAIAEPEKPEMKVDEPEPMVVPQQLLPTLRPPAGSFSGGSVDGGDSDDEGGQLQVFYFDLKNDILSNLL